MSVVEGPSGSGLVARVINILTKPAAEWDVIEREPATVGGLYTGYAMVLAAIPAIGGALGVILWTHLLVTAIVAAVLGYVLSLVGVYVMSLIVDMLATNFGGQRDPIQALKLMVYSYTAAWVAGIGAILPGPLGRLVGVLGGLYSLYLLFLGLPKLMKSPPEQTVVYFVVIIVVAIVIYLVIAIVLGIIAAMLAVGAVVGGSAALGGIH